MSLKEYIYMSWLSKDLYVCVCLFADMNYVNSASIFAEKKIMWRKRNTRPLD